MSKGHVRNIQAGSKKKAEAEFRAYISQQGGAKYKEAIDYLHEVGKVPYSNEPTYGQDYYSGAKRHGGAVAFLPSLAGGGSNVPTYSFHKDQLTTQNYQQVLDAYETYYGTAGPTGDFGGGTVLAKNVVNRTPKDKLYNPKNKGILEELEQMQQTRLSRPKKKVDDRRRTLGAATILGSSQPQGYITDSL